MARTPSSQTVLITGAAIRVGKAMALHLAAQGWNVAIHCNRSADKGNKLAKEIEKLGVKAAVIVADLEQSKQVGKIVAQAGTKLGPIHALINNAAIFEKDNLETLSDKLWQRHIAINLYAPLQLMRDFAKQVPAKVTGNIINIGDGLEGWSVSSNFLSYSMSKIGIMAASELLATSLAPRIRINSINPGFALPGDHDKVGFDVRIRNMIPMKQASSPEELCAAVDFILASPSLTGQNINLAGGFG